MLPANSRSTVVLHQAALGDFVLILPLLQRLQATGDRVTVVTASSKAKLAAELLPGLQAASIEQPVYTLLHADEVTAGELQAAHGAALLQGAQRVVSFVSNGQDAWARNLRRLAPKAELYCVEPRPSADFAGHVTHWHQQQLAAQRLVLPAVAQQAVQRGDGPWVLHPGSGGMGKCWPLAHWEQLLGMARARSIPVQPVLGEAELDRLEPAVLQRWSQRYGAKLLQDLPSLLAVLRGARGYLGHDSGPTHLAAFLGLPTLAIFGPTSPKTWAPLGPAVLTLAPPRPEAMNWLRADELWQRWRAWDEGSVHGLGD